jgi:hypothetical protein
MSVYWCESRCIAMVVEENGQVAMRAQKREGRDTRKCNYCCKVGHIEKNCWAKKRDEEKTNTANFAFSARASVCGNVFSRILSRSCYECRAKDHEIRDCLMRVRVKSEIIMPPRDDLNEGGSSAKMARWSQFYSFVSIENSFQTIDSGASNHMCAEKKMFQKLKMGFFGEIIVDICSKNGTKWSVNNFFWLQLHFIERK